MVCCKAIKFNGEDCVYDAVIGGYCAIHFRSQASFKERRLLKAQLNKVLTK